MALLFQANDDVDEAVKEETQIMSWIGGLVLVIFAGLHYVVSWISGHSVRKFERSDIVMLAVLFLLWLCNPYYQEFRIRTKETYGKVAAIEKTILAMQENQIELLKALDSIEEKLETIHCDLPSEPC